MSKKKDSVSVVEFKAWLSGIEEMQPKSWSPSKEQWAKIRAKIEQLVDNVGNNYPQPPQYSGQFTQQPRPTPQPYQQPLDYGVSPQPVAAMPPLTNTILDSPRQVIDSDENYDSPFV